MIHFIAILISIARAEDVLVIGTPPQFQSEVLRLDSQRAEQIKLSELMPTLPNVSFSSGANRPRFFQIRGVGETGQFEHSQVSSLGVFYEGIDFSEESSALPLLGRENLEVSYGPQSIDWGGKALAGTLEAASCLEHKCSNHRWAFSGANYNTYRLVGASRWKAGRVSGIAGLSRMVSDGFYTNEYLDQATSNLNDTDILFGLGYKIGEWKLRQHHVLVEHDDGYDSWAFEPSFRTLSDHPGKDRISLHGHSLQYAKGAWRGLTSVTLVQQLESYDEDWGNNPYWNTIPGWNTDYNYYSSFERKRLKLHQKIARSFGEDAEMGVHFYRFSEKQIIRSYEDESLRKITEPSFQSQHLSLWLAKEWRRELWTWEAATRVEGQWLELEGLGGQLRDEGEPLWGADLRARRLWSERRISEFSLTRGYRGEGYNTSPSLSRDLLHFGPEEIYLAQFSMEGFSENGRWLLRFFHQWRERQQVRSSLQTDPMDPSTFTYFTENDGSSRAYGLEGLVDRKWTSWKASVSLGLMNSRFGHREVSQSPPWSYSARLDYQPSAFGAYVQITGRDGYFFADDHEFKSRPYTLVDAGISWRTGKWELKLWVQNLFDKRYPVRAFYFANEPPAWEPKYYAQLGDPRTFGAVAVFEY